MIYISIILICFGLSIRLLTVCELKSNTHWRIINPHNLVKTGIYSLVRHPMYLGGILDYSGLCLLLTRNIGTTIVLLIVLFNFILDRIDREEQFLILMFGQEYLDYMNKVKMLIPFIF